MLSQRELMWEDSSGRHREYKLQWEPGTGRGSPCWAATTSPLHIPSLAHIPGSRGLSGRASLGTSFHLQSFPRQGWLRPVLPLGLRTQSRPAP